MKYYVASEIFLEDFVRLLDAANPVSTKLRSGAPKATTRPGLGLSHHTQPILSGCAKRLSIVAA